jgi:osomolarity two-component system, sensor histidine kinase SLN1
MGILAVPFGETHTDTCTAMQAGGSESNYNGLVAPMSRVHERKTLSNPAPGQVLPAPVLQSLPEGSNRSCKKQTRFQENTKSRLKSMWQHVLGKFNTSPIPPSSDADTGADDSDTGDYYDTWWGSNKRGMALAEAEEIDEVVVDREWSDGLKSYSSSDQGGDKVRNFSAANDPSVLSPVAEGESETIHTEGLARATGLRTFIRWRIWPAVYDFFDTQFVNQHSEELYKRENWHLRKVYLSPPNQPAYSHNF